MADIHPVASGSAPKVTLEGILEPERVLCDVAARSKKHSLDMLSELLAEGERPLHKLDVFEHLVSRERLGSTAIGHGIAIPHARLESLQQIRAAFIRLTEAVEFDAADDKPIYILFGLLVPSGDEQNHLSLLSTIAKMLADPAYRAALDEAADGEALYDLLTAFDPPADSDDATDRS